MLKQISLMLVVAVLAQSAPVQEPVNETWKELPCLGKVAGQRLPHPKNNHQFLRCVTADSVWIETCPDNLFYNPHSNVCDWDMEAKETTTSKPEVVKTRPVLVKFRPVDESGMRSVQSTVVQDAQQPGLLNPSGQEILTTASPVQMTTVTTTPRVEIVFDTTPVTPVIIEQSTSTVQQSVVVDAQTPAATFEVPVSTQVVVVDSISSTTPVATFEIAVSTTTVAVPHTPAVVVVETTTPVFVRTTTPIVLTTTRQVPVVAVETTTLPVVELSTESPISLRL